ncbi:MAG: hypothetical protein HC827_12045 [Cyanobacteria bacterium RM1_2_2]|nr:hypothetical protein [Cyanobacteria bacterium RM1_2_2]
MSDRLFPDFADAMEWNLVARDSYTAPTAPTPANNRLPNRSFLIENSHAVIIGVNSIGARSTWSTGGWAAQILPFLPSSTSTYVAAVQSGKRWLRLRTLNLVVFPKFTSTWILDLSFPYWLPDVSIEVWRYDGRDIDQFQRFNELEARLP